jgi:hypothetical protein
MRGWICTLLALVVLTPAGLGQGVEVKVTDNHVEFFIGKDLVTRYHVKGFEKPIFYPLFAPGNVPLTRSWPIEEGKPNETIDHPHQKSAWFVHGDVIPEGLKLKEKNPGVEGVDFWAELGPKSKTKGFGKIVCTSVGKATTSQDKGQVITKNEWRTLDGTKIMDETRTIAFYDLGKARLIVLDIDLHASVYPITFGDTKEGAMGIRINDQIKEGMSGKGKIRNAEGKVGEKECWGYVSAWCDYSGPIDGKVVGLTILADPKNPYPSCWHCRGYGLMAANPFGRSNSKFPEMKGRTDLVKIAKGEHLRFRYGLLAHEGDAEMGRVAEHYQRFVQLGTKD